MTSEHPDAPRSTRPATPVDELAERYYRARLDLSPIDATMLGLSSGQDRYDDFSPDGHAALADLASRTLAEAHTLRPVDETDRVTLAALDERLGLEVETHDAGEDLPDVNGIATGLHAIQQVHDLMPQSTDDDWALIARRLRAVPEAIEGWFVSQDAAIGAGLPPAARQVDVLIEQCRAWVAPGGYFDSLGAAAGTRPGSLAGELSSALQVAKQAFDAAANRLASHLAPRAADRDGVGRERYLLASRQFLGTTIDVDETYAWGQEEVARLDAQMAEVADRIVPGASVGQAQDALDADPRYQIHGVDALARWMQERADEAIRLLVDGGHFAIPEQIRRLECRIADTHDGGIYYTGPSDDFSRPGRMWWSVPEGVDTFRAWHELTTVYHEGVPGHHLQIASAIANRDLNLWRRNGVWVSAHAEGWALYAERLMPELGLVTDPGMVMGQLDDASLRAVRVVLDLGIHCGLPAPASVGGGEWRWDKAWRYFNDHTRLAEPNARYELLRYYGWPGQAPSYKLGERCWLDLRERVRAQDPGAFSLPEFHRVALDLGELGLDVLTDAVLAAFPGPGARPDAGSGSGA
ncbi:DUF885 domain-containing protein [Brooklawnia cerclae]|uniref:Uncharacterized protein (DUF885 family) n=1 Tax=Brooklawnia cerclae TaxID=349934 RepID=A0ABX0SJM0_9ACTN|nr:DUF885 domain-containing protein [Brooklawnia cerclae]NIH58622.1 uncharacterized protein (DUF885 family) [Brooklawnia cerclae]